MKPFSVIFVLLGMAFCVSARPRYIAIPADEIQFINFAPVTQEKFVRVARAADYRPIVSDVDSVSSEARLARQADHHGGDPHDYVDFGAHTGHHGAFGWYADFPVHAHER